MVSLVPSTTQQLFLSHELSITVNIMGFVYPTIGDEDIGKRRRQTADGADQPTTVKNGC